MNAGQKARLVMAWWVVRCRNCKDIIKHALIAETTLESFYYPIKPETPAGLELECPSCGHKTNYVQTDLFYLR